MPPFDFARFERLLAEGYSLTSTQCLEDGLRIYAAKFRLFAAFALLLPVLNLAIDLVAPPGWGLVIGTFLLAPALNAGYYLAANQVAGGRTPLRRHFLGGFRLFVPLVLNNLIYMLILAVVLSPSYMVLDGVGFFDWYWEAARQPANPPEPPEISPQGSTVLTLNLIPLLYLVVGYVWASPFILFFGLGPWQALEASRRLVSRRWGVLFLLVTTFFTLLLLGSMLLSSLNLVSPALAGFATLSLFLFSPWYFSALYVGFAQATVALDAPPPSVEEEAEEEEQDEVSD